jgi:hypothetical protein
MRRVGIGFISEVWSLLHVGAARKLEAGTNQASAAADLKLSHAVLALAIYSAISLFCFAPRSLSQVAQNYRGLDSDPTIYMWAVSWWPYAIAHRLNPFITPMLWAPAGYNLARATGMPGPSLMVYPITRAFGPVVTYNLLCVAVPIAAGFSAFLLCRYLCQCFWPAFLGGYIFGFSQYVLSHMAGHLVLLFIFPVPLAIYALLLRIEGRVSRYSFVILLALLLGFEFLSSTELFATSTLFGAITFALAFLLFIDARAKLGSIIREVLLAYAVLMIILSPYFYFALAPGLPPIGNPAAGYANDLLSFVLPTRVMLLGGNLFAPITAKFSLTWVEMAAYLGPGVWLIFTLFMRANWHNKTCKLLIAVFGLIALASLGPRLHIAGRSSIGLPWLLTDRLPLIDLALPGRFGMYLFLVAGVIVAIHLSSPGISFWSRVLLGACAVAFVAPNLAFTQSTTKVRTPVFFRSGEYRKYISQGDIILLLPYNAANQAMLWQAQTGFSFRMVTGFYLPPEEYRHWPITPSFVDSRRISNFAEQLESFLGAHQVKAVIVDSASAGRWPGLLSEAGLTAVVTGGIIFYRVSPGVLSTFRNATARQMVARQTAGLFRALLIAATRYLEAGFPLAKLTPAEVQRLKLLTLPKGTLAPVGASNWWQNLWLGGWGGGVGIGIAGDYGDLAYLVWDYGPHATDAFFPYPEKLSLGRHHREGLLLIIFSPDGLRQAANEATGHRLVRGNESLSRSPDSRNQ